MFCSKKPQKTFRLRMPFQIISLTIFLSLLSREVAEPRLKMPPRMRTLPSPAPSPSTYSIHFVVYATVTNVGTEHIVENKYLWQNAMAPKVHRRSHRHSNHVKKRRRQNARGRGDDDRTERMVAELMEEMKETKKEKEKTEQYQQNNTTRTNANGIDLITWQLFSQCSRAFVRIRADNGKVDARGGTGEAEDECQTLFSPELVAGERGARGLLRLVHLRSGRLLCLGRRRGLIARKRTSLSLSDPLCWLREHLTSSGYTSLSAARPIGFSRVGRPITHPSHIWNESGRCFQFAKLISRRRVHQKWQRRCPLPSTVPMPTARRTRAGDDLALREMARRALLAKIEARGEEDGSGTTEDEPFTISISI